jgi:hypothetical protein
MTKTLSDPEVDLYYKMQFGHGGVKQKAAESQETSTDIPVSSGHRLP